MTLGRMVRSSLTLSKNTAKTQQYSPNDPMQNDFQQNSTSIMTLRGIINITVTWLSVALLNVMGPFNYLRKTFLDRKRNIVVPRLLNLLQP